MDKHTSYQPGLFSDAELDPVKPVASGPVQCLGMEFENEEARREYFRDKLRRKLPELRQIEGFPIGEDEDIIRLSDPPYYTACPNPWLNDFIQQWEEEKKDLTLEGKRSDSFKVSTPYAQGISAKKNHPIYNAHSYHTKVPHEIIMRYLFHYTQPGDIVLDNFGGTGMTGVACNEISQSNKYLSTFKDITNKKWGYRKCIIGDLSPLASFITHNYTTKNSVKEFKTAADNIFNTLEAELSWMYKTQDENKIGEVNYYIWSEVQICPYCGKEFVYWDAAVDLDNSSVKDKYECPHCKCIINKRDSQKSLISYYDESLEEVYDQVKYVPVVVNYNLGSKRVERVVNEYDKKVLEDIKSLNAHDWFPINRMMGIGEKWGDTWRAGYHVGFTHVHNFYTRRNLIILARFHSLIESYDCDDVLKNYLRVWFTSCLSRLHIMNRYAAKHHRHVGPLANTLYISATPAEISPFYFIKSKIKDNAIEISNNHNIINQVASATHSIIKDNSIDYIFTDPPFGGNIMYSELNYISESWLGLFTNNKDEAITNDTQKKGKNEYHELMLSSFKEYYRILKPNGWMTVEFSNTSAAIWNSIQQAIQQAGFIIAYVSDLNKGRGGLHGIYNVVAVNQDLAITCYKPSNNYTISSQEDTIKGVGDFISDFLSHLPIHIEQDCKTSSVVERSPKILYDRLISYYVQKGWPIPMDAGEFQDMLRNTFIERDGMFFTASQALEYEEKRKETKGVIQMSFLISNEEEGIMWLKDKLKDTPKTYQEIQPDWMTSMTAPKKGDRLPELLDILEENFIKDEDGYWRKPDAEKAADLEALRLKRMAKEFALYLEQARKPKAKRMKDCRLEVLRYGFKDCYKRKDYEAIIAVGDHIQESLLLEDEILLQYYDSAAERV